MLLECLDPETLARLSMCSRFVTPLFISKKAWGVLSHWFYDALLRSRGKISKLGHRNSIVEKKHEILCVITMNAQGFTTNLKPISGFRAIQSIAVSSGVSFPSPSGEKGISDVDISQTRESYFSPSQQYFKTKQNLMSPYRISYKRDNTEIKSRSFPRCTSTKCFCVFCVTTGTVFVSANFTLHAYQEYHMSVAVQYDESPLYLFYRTFATKALSVTFCTARDYLFVLD
jgi:hypothetical protein